MLNERNSNPSIPVTIYTKSNCPYCVRAKELFKRKGVSFSEINLDGQEAAYEQLKNKTGMRTVPQIFIGDTLVGGYTELAELEEQNQLDKKLGLS